MKIKYTSDGKKVAVVGKLNSQETIVQEIFVMNENEIPSGENFVVKSLHDAPAKSWKETQVEKIEANFNSKKSEYETELKRLRVLYDKQRTEMREKIKWFGEALKNINEATFEELVNFICGDTTHVVIEEYAGPSILPIDKFQQTYEDSLRLVSIFGRSNGVFSYGMGEYGDYSGEKKIFHPFTSYEKAFEKFEDILIKSRVSDSVVKIAKENNINLDSDKLSKFLTEKKATLTKNIEQYESAISTWKKDLKSIDL